MGAVPQPQRPGHIPFLEAAELLKISQWKDAGEVQAGKSDEEIRRRGKRGTEPMNPADIIFDKLQVNDEKYPAEMLEGKSDKYTPAEGRGNRRKNLKDKT